MPGWFLEFSSDKLQTSGKWLNSFQYIWDIMSISKVYILDCHCFDPSTSIWKIIEIGHLKWLSHSVGVGSPCSMCPISPPCVFWRHESWVCRVMRSPVAVRRRTWRWLWLMKWSQPHPTELYNWWCSNECIRKILARDLVELVVCWSTFEMAPEVDDGIY